MFNVTDRAKELITKSLFAKELITKSLHAREDDPDMLLRLKKSETEPEKLGLILGRELKSDMVVKNNDGLNVLVINSDLASNLSTVVLDVQNTSEGDQYVLTDAKMASRR